MPAIPYKLKGTKIIVFDTETTGVTEDDEIIQLSIIDGNGKTLINEYVHPYWKKDWAAAARVNGITPEMVKDAPYPHDLIPKVKDSGKEQYDVMLEFAQEYGEWNEYFGDYKWQKLSTAAFYYGYKFKAHDSLEDVRATLYVYKKLQAQESEL